jgi:hypothetical protein
MQSAGVALRQPLAEFVHRVRGLAVERQNSGS